MLAGQAVLKRMLFALDAPHPLAWLFGAAAIVALTAVAAAYPPAMRAASIESDDGAAGGMSVRSWGTGELGNWGAGEEPLGRTFVTRLRDPRRSAD